MLHQIGVIIREARRAKNMSQEELAARVGIAAQSLSKIERGRRTPTLQTMTAIMRELEMPPQVMIPFIGISVNENRAVLVAQLLASAASLLDDELELAIAQVRALAAHSKSKSG